MLIPLVIVARPALAQANLGVGSIGGTIRDESNAVVVGAKVILAEESKGFVRESESNSAGAFLFPSVIAGSYSVRGEKQGFSSGRLNDLTIEVGEQASVEITLHVGEVNATSPLLRSRSRTIDLT
jgi:carboxypeptidase family protein